MGRGGEGFPRRVPYFLAALVGEVASPAYEDDEAGTARRDVVDRKLRGTPRQLERAIHASD